ncbi:MAG: SdrD B-like domain-containing protein, partial [Coriobacteriia bacterium]|nr:SdrD B-like domain-containing protein [Coriobacteriia bacterium]
MTNAFWKRVRGGTPGSRIFAAYLALVLTVAMVGPGLAVFASEGVAEVAPEVAVEPAPVEVVEPAPVEVVEPAPVVAAEVSISSVEAGPATVVAAAAVVAAAVVPGGSTNLALTFQGVRKNFGWTTGNLQTWNEGDWVPFRLIIENKDSVNDVSVPAIIVTLDHYNGTAIMYDETRLWSYYFTDTDPARGDAQYPAATALAPLSQDVPIDPAIWGTGSLIMTTFAPDEIVVPAGQYAVLYFQAHLAVTAEWNLADPPRNGAGYVAGSSGHGQLAMTGVGAKTVPAPSVPKPVEPTEGDLIVYKFEDLNENGEWDEGEPMLEDWAFTLYDAEDVEVDSGLTDINGELPFGELEAGDYSVTETLQSGWVNTTLLTQTVTIVAGQTAELWFGN